MTAEECADLIAVTLRDLGKGNWTDISQDLQEFTAMSRLLKEERVGFGSGTSLDFQVRYRTGGQAKMTGLFPVDNVNVSQTMVGGNVPWRFAQTAWAIERREMAMNRNPSRIVELIKLRRSEALIDMAFLMENQFWNKPATSADTTNLFGVDYWIPWAVTQGFNGPDPAGFASGAAGLPVATYPHWANYTDVYVNPTPEDLIRKWRRAATMTAFKNPVDIPDFNTGDRYGYFTTYPVLAALEEILEQQNENLGNDIASKDGKVAFRGVPVTWVPLFDSLPNHLAANPVYGINWGVFKPIFLESEYMVEDGPKPMGNQHTVLRTFIDSTLNLICRDRRRLFVLAMSDPHE